MSKTIVITGASSGIGQRLAHEFAARGYQLGLLARRLEVLEELKAEVQAKHPAINIHCASLDVSQPNDVRKALQELASKMGNLNIVVANAGIASSAKIGSGRFAADQAVVETNITGAFATIDTAVEIFKQQGQGHIVAIASVAAFRGMPTAATYCASKAALSTYMDALRAELYHSPIKVTTLFPGYIDTPINNMMPNRPFVISVEKGGKIIADLIERQVKSSTVPVWPWNLIGPVMKVIPTRFLAGKKRS